MGHVVYNTLYRRRCTWRALSGKGEEQLASGSIKEYTAMLTTPAPTTTINPRSPRYTMTAPGQTWASAPQLDHISSHGTQMPTDAFDEARKHTQQPIVTGTSVLAIKYKDGVMMAADTLASYGSLARFMDVRRIKYVEGANALVGCSGDMSDFQHIQHSIDNLMWVRLGSCTAGRKRKMIE